MKNTALKKLSVITAALAVISMAGCGESAPRYEAVTGAGGNKNAYYTEAPAMMDSAAAAGDYENGDMDMGMPSEAPMVEGGQQVEFNTEEYNSITENSYMSVAANPLSTFSIDVDTAS